MTIYYHIDDWENKGIVQIDNGEVDPDYKNAVMIKWVETFGPIRITERSVLDHSIFETREEAVAAAKRARTNKIRQLRRRVDKLLAMKIK
jgi:hypothetical protein